MDELNRTFVDGNGQTIEVSASDFELVQTDTKIHDQKFETKVTTFFKDAMKRFAKNKASVVGAIILGVIVLFALIWPSVSPYDVTDSNAYASYQTLLRPKLFSAGTGFWDGTEKYTNVAVNVDSETGEPIKNEETGYYSLVNSLFVTSAILEMSDAYEDSTSSTGWSVDLVYDPYEATFGVVTQTVYGYQISSWVTSGWVSIDEDTGYITILSDECPIEAEVGEVIEPTGSGLTGYRYTLNIAQYKTYGYSSMPKFIFGTTSQGYDLFTYALKGLRTSILLAFAIAAICFIFGLIWGSISGYFGGNVDLIMERISDILNGVPYIVVVTLCVLHLGSGIGVFLLALCMTRWIGTASRTRTQFYRFKGREYVLAARTLGASDTRLIFRHILPNSLGTIVTSSVMLIPGVIYTESTLSYLGLSIGDTVSFGRVLSANQSYLNSYPALILFPAIILALMMISFNLFGNGLRDALNPTLKGSD